MDPTMMTDESEAQAETGAEAATEGFSVELYVAADGSMSVNVESGAEEAEQHGGEMPTGTPVKSLKEAVEMIIQVVKNGGKMDTPEDEAAFSEGFGGKGAPARFG
jgi:hypothetical protein